MRKIAIISQFFNYVDDKISRDGLVVIPHTAHYKQIVLECAATFVFEVDALKQLTKYLGINFIDRPKLLKYKKWHPTICPKLNAVKYYNPYCPKEYIVMVHRYKVGTDECLYHSPQGYFSILWFAEYVPNVCLQSAWNQLQAGAFGKPPYDFRIQPNRTHFTKQINEPINRNHTTLDPYSIKVVHGLFDIYLPFIDGICPKCFKTSFPEKGQGIRYQNVVSDYHMFDIKLSTSKPDGYPAQRKIYITNTLLINGQQMHVEWTPWTDTEPILHHKAEANTHIPFRQGHYQQAKLDRLLATESFKKDVQAFIKTKKEIEVPLCRCR